MLTSGTVPGLFDDYLFRPQSTIVAAVSGGSDSTALLLLLNSHLSIVHPTIRLLAATVDHALRPGSSAEAEAVAVLCRHLNIEHRILSWTGAKPSTGVQAAARLARHSLLAELAHREGAAAVMVGHTADDQAETVMMRQARGSGIGSAGIAPATLFRARTWFVRPLLGCARAELRTYLRGQGIGWTDDPSNADARFERARLRAALGQSTDAAARKTAALEEAQAAQRARQDLGARAAALIGRYADCPVPGLVRLDRHFLAVPDEAARLHVLRILIAVAGGAAQLPPVDKAQALLSGQARRATLSRAVIDSRKGGLFILRENRNLPPAQVQEGQLWDGRFWLVSDSRPPGILPMAENLPASLLQAAASTLPDVSGIGLRAEPIVAPWADFLPSFDLEAARAVARLIGVDIFSDPPLAGHIKLDV